MTSVDRSIGAEPHRWPTAVWFASAFWIAAGGTASALSIRQSEGSGRTVLVAAAVVSAAALGAGLALGWFTGHASWLAAGLVASGLSAPTTFAYPLNAVPIVAGIALVLWVRRARPIRDL